MGYAHLRPDEPSLVDDNDSAWVFDAFVRKEVSRMRSYALNDRLRRPPACTLI